MNTNIDIKGKAYEELVGANLRGDRGEFFTPRNVMHMTVEMVNPGIHEKVLDSSCGTGGFLVTAMNHVIDKLKKEFENEFGKEYSEWDSNEIIQLQNKISEVAGENFFGFDINPDLVKATKMNMVMNNNGSGNILRNNSLLHPHEWDLEFKTMFADRMKIKKEVLKDENSIGFFDVIVTNPPFGSKIPISDPQILKQYDLGHIWEKNGTGWKKTNRLQASVPPEQLFIERCMQLLKEGGRMGIVLPDSILGSPGLGYLRQWLIEHGKLISSVDLHVDTFQPRNGTQTSVLFIQKKTKKELAEESSSGNMKDYNIFMAMAEKIGHDKRGTPIFKRDEYGNELLVSEEIIENNDGIQTKQVVMKKVIDDQTLEIAEEFVRWKKDEGVEW